MLLSALITQRNSPQLFLPAFAMYVIVHHCNLVQQRAVSCSFTLQCFLGIRSELKHTESVPQVTPRHVRTHNKHTLIDNIMTHRLILIMRMVENTDDCISQDLGRKPAQSAGILKVI